MVRGYEYHLNVKSMFVISYYPLCMYVAIIFYSFSRRKSMMHNHTRLGNTWRLRFYEVYSLCEVEACISIIMLHNFISHDNLKLHSCYSKGKYYVWLQIHYPSMVVINPSFGSFLRCSFKKFWRKMHEIYFFNVRLIFIPTISSH